MSIWSCLGILFSSGKLSDTGSVVLQGGRFADTQESAFQAAKRSDMGNAVLKRWRFPDTNQSRFQNVKRWNICSRVLQGVRKADAQELRIQASIRSDMARADSKDFCLLSHKNRVFRMRNIQICVLPSCKWVDLLLLRNRAKWSDIVYPFMQVAPFVDAQELCFHLSNHSDMSRAIVQRCHFLMLKNATYPLPNALIWVVLCMGVDLLIFRNCAFSLRNTQTWADPPYR